MHCSGVDGWGMTCTCMEVHLKHLLSTLHFTQHFKLDFCSIII